jgi:hypothetical protein
VQGKDAWGIGDGGGEVSAILTRFSWKYDDQVGPDQKRALSRRTGCAYQIVWAPLITQLKTALDGSEACENHHLLR